MRSIQESDPIGPSVIPIGDEAGRRRRRVRWSYGGFVLGLGLGLAYTAIQVANSGYTALLFCFVLASIGCPLLGAVVGRVVSRTRPKQAQPWKLPQLRVYSLMALVAYSAFFLGGGIWSYKLTITAFRDLNKSLSSAEMAKIHRKLQGDSRTNAALRRANVEGLHEGKIPVGLLPIQRDFLRDLESDSKVTPDYRAYRRGLITESEEEHRRWMENNVGVLGRIVDHFERLADKYEWHRWHPWMPIDPDPPVPN